jgi:hypothetical protein
MAGKKSLPFIPAQAISRLVFNLRMPDDAVRRILAVVLTGGDDSTELSPPEEVIATNILDEIAAYNTRYNSRVESHREAQARYRKGLKERGNHADEVISRDITRGHEISRDISNPSDTGTERNGTDVPNIRGTVSPPPPEGENRVTITSTRFKVPSQQEVAEFFESRGGSAGDAERFHDHYTANGWRVGRAAMKDWRAAARNWMRSDSFGPGGGAVPAKKEAAAPAQDGAYPVVLSPEERWGGKKGEP